METLWLSVTNAVSNFCCRKAHGPPLCEAEALCYEQMLRWLENMLRVSSGLLEGQLPKAEDE